MITLTIIAIVAVILGIVGIVVGFGVLATFGDVIIAALVIWFFVKLLIGGNKKGSNKRQ